MAQPPGPRRLNNLVTELLHVEGDAARSARTFTFENPREGWVYFRSRATIGSTTPTTKVPWGVVRVLLNESDVPLTWHREYITGPCEAMRWLPQGSHNLVVDAVEGCSLDSLTVRAVPEIIFSHYLYNPYVREFGPYDWDALARMGILDVANVLIVDHGDPHVLEWTKCMGKRLLRHDNPPGLHTREAVNADDVFRAWAATDSKHNFCHGLIIDEFYPGQAMSAYKDAWVEGIRKFYAERPGRLLYPYIAGDPDGLRPFVEPLLSTPCRFAYERYLGEMPTESQAKAVIQQKLVEAMEQFREFFPDFQKRCVIVMGFMTAPPASDNVEPLADIKTYLDMQMNVYATHPAYDGLFGIELWSSGYCDEEHLRWFAKMVRHYCIEGKTERLSNDPYELRHIRNPDFADGLAGWSVSAAGPETVSVGRIEGYNRLQGRYKSCPTGDNFLRMVRTAERPNVVSQEMTGFQPGRAYSVKLVVGDARELTRKEIRPCSIRVEDAEILPAYSFQGLYRQSHWMSTKEYGQDNPAWFNLIRVVFRPRSETARLVISDWTSDTEPGGRIGQELAFNFIQVEPYLMSDETSGE